MNEVYKPRSRSPRIFGYFAIAGYSAGLAVWLLLCLGGATAAVSFLTPLIVQFLVTFGLFEKSAPPWLSPERG